MVTLDLSTDVSKNTNQLERWVYLTQWKTPRPTERSLLSNNQCNTGELTIGHLVESCRVLLRTRESDWLNRRFLFAGRQRLPVLWPWIFKVLSRLFANKSKISRTAC